MEKKTLYTIYDGLNLCGLGSLLQAQQHLYAYTKHNNLNMYFPGFANVGHHKYTLDSQSEHDKKINNFYNIPDKNFENADYITDDYLINSWGRDDFNLKLKKKYIKELSNYIKYNGPILFEDGKINVAVHIRSENPCDFSSEITISNREIYYKNNFKNLYFKKLFKNIMEKFGSNINILIFSQGENEDFKEYSEEFNAKLCINYDLIETVYHLIHADILVTSNSSLSYSSHLYNRNKLVISRDSFSHRWYEDTLLTERNGDFINLEEKHLKLFL